MEINITNDQCVIERYSDKLVCPHCNNEMDTNYNTDVFDESIIYRGDACSNCGEHVYFKVKTLTLFSVKK